MNKKPTTPAEVFRFQNNGIWEILHSLTEQLEDAKQIVTITSDVLSDYESVLKTISKHSVCEESRNDAKYVLKKYKIK